MTRIEKEKLTVEKMIRIFCKGQGHPHSALGLCPECQELLEYAHKRLERCRFQEAKSTCQKCPIHCYKPLMRERMRAVMRYSGPRMILHHPLLSILHLIDNLKK